MTARGIGSGAGGHAPLEHPIAREVAGERAATPLLAVDFESPPVAMQRVFDDGEPEPRAAGVARTARIHAVETFRQPRQMLRRNTGAAVTHREMRALIVS